MPELNSIIEQASANTIQSSASGGMDNIWVVNWMSRAGLAIAPWWSPSRDVQLRDFWKKSDHLAGALYTMEAKMSAIPFRIIPQDRSNKDNIITANTLTDVLLSTAQFGDGWVSLYSKFIEDLLSQDNGAFIEVIGAGRKDGPIEGMPISIAHLDSHRCTRTGNALYPVVYEDTDGKRYKLHYQRVMFTSQMPSPISEMFGVGFCAISRAINVAQTLIDILVYKQEKLGSRPHRQLIITRGGLDPNDLSTAFQIAESHMDNSGLSRYSKVVVGGSSSIPDAGLDVVELSKMPDGFDEETSVTLGMATIALAFGVDARELFPAMGSGASRADALLQHLKQRGKGPGQILQITEQLINYKFLPMGFYISFDFQDDAEDRQRAEIRKIRADRRVQDMSTGAISDRILREQMVEDGEVTQEQFERMELDSGRLSDGIDSISLFMSKDKKIKKLLDLGIENPLKPEENDAEAVLGEIEDNMIEIYAILANSGSESERWNALKAQSALNQLKVMYEKDQEEEKNELMRQQITGVAPEQNQEEDGTQENWVEDRVRTQDVTGVTEGDRQSTGSVAEASEFPAEDKSDMRK